MLMKTTYRTVLEEGVVSATPSEIWHVLTDPVAMVTVDDHPVDVVEPSGDPRVAGSRWIEVHEPSCGNDRVRVRVARSEDDTHQVLQLWQRGICMTIDRRLEHITADSTRVVVTTSYRPALAGRPGQQVLPWLLLAIGVMPKLAADSDDAWFDRLGEAARPKTERA
ncbi:hypothetical protein [Microbacterium sp. ZW T5_56]|uniref:hypothetical protein n=1 Tax=Microbacterium sp. ZW T5_56 TaxID=3378081 RepID=UPI0038534B48